MLEAQLNLAAECSNDVGGAIWKISSSAERFQPGIGGVEMRGVAEDLEDEDGAPWRKEGSLWMIHSEQKHGSCFPWLNESFIFNWGSFVSELRAISGDASAVLEGRRMVEYGGILSVTKGVLVRSFFGPRCSAFMLFSIGVTSSAELE